MQASDEMATALAVAVGSLCDGKTEALVPYLEGT
jgi:hypothetical protein